MLDRKGSRLEGEGEGGMTMLKEELHAPTANSCFS